MPQVNTGNKRASKVIVEKYVDEVLETGYPKTYNALLSFSAYSAITLTQLAELSDTDYAARMSAFEIYVEGEEAGASFSSDLQAGYERIINDEGTCPLEYNPVIDDFIVATNSLIWTMLDGSEDIGDWIISYSLDNATWTFTERGGSPGADILPVGTYNQDVYFRVRRWTAPISNHSYEFSKNVGTIT